MALRMPSVQAVYENVIAVVRRFPLAAGIAVAAAVASQFIVGGPLDHDSLRTILILMIGLPFAICLPLLRERGQHRRTNLLAHLLFALLIFWFYRGWPDWSDGQSLRRLVQLKLAFLLLLAGLPYWNFRELRGFWQFNRSLLLRFLQATAFAFILATGLTVLLAALDQLFGVDIDGDLYLRLWLLVMTLFHPLYVLGGIPSTLTSLQHLEDYAPALRILGQFILMPLVAAYLLLLLAYFVKIVLTTEWPSGSIGWLVSAAAIVGMLSLLLLHPLAEKRGGEWIARYRHAYYAGMIPALCMLLVALAKRIAQYGWTENRYFLAVLAVWLLTLCLMHLLVRWRDIRWIPMSLAAVALLSGFGPWGAYSVSKRSQMGRFLTVLQGAGLLRDGVAGAAAIEIDFETRRELSALTLYMVENHGLLSLRPVFADQWVKIESDSTITGEFSRYQGNSVAQRVLEAIDVGYVESWRSANEEFFNFFANQNEGAVEIAEFDVVWDLGLSGTTQQTLMRGGETWTIQLLKGNILRVTSPLGSLSEAPLDSLLGAARDAGSVGQRPPLQLDVNHSELHWMLELNNIAARKQDGSFMVQNLQGRLYIQE
jgi:hypothetical protein